MNREPEEMQFLGLFGIYLESYKIIILYRKIFSQITLTLILPLSFIFLARIEINNFFFSEIAHNNHNKIANLVSWEKVFKFFYLTFSLMFSLLSTSAVVYTIACIYTSREVSFREVTSVVPKVWKRLIVAFLCAFIVFSIYNTIFLIIFVVWAFTIATTNAGVIPSLLIILILYIIGFVYLGVIWQLASVLSVLEDFYVFKAMMRSKNLIKGNLWISMAIFSNLVFSTVVIVSIYECVVVRLPSGNSMIRTGLGLLCLLLLCKLILFGLVINTVIYFVCKSYHHESIDKSILSDHLDVYLGDYVRLKAKDVQLEGLHV